MFDDRIEVQERERQTSDLRPRQRERQAGDLGHRYVDAEAVGGLALVPERGTHRVDTNRVSRSVHDREPYLSRSGWREEREQVHAIKSLRIGRVDCVRGRERGIMARGSLGKRHRQTRAPATGAPAVVCTAPYTMRCVFCGSQAQGDTGVPHTAARARIEMRPSRFAISSSPCPRGVRRGSGSGSTRAYVAESHAGNPTSVPGRHPAAFLAVLALRLLEPAERAPPVAR